MENNRMGKTRDLFKKIPDNKGTFHAKMGTIKDINGMDLTEAEDIKKRWQEYTEELYKKDLPCVLATSFKYCLLLLNPCHFCPLLCPSLHEKFPWYI